MEIFMSENFKPSAIAAAKKLNSNNPKIYLEPPFEGFYVVVDLPNEMKSLYQFEDEGKNIYVLSNSPFGA